MSLATPNYVTCEDIMFMVGPTDVKTLPAGTFVRPVHPTYVPEHVKKDFRCLHFSEETHEYYYTPMGFLVLRKDKVRKV